MVDVNAMCEKELNALKQKIDERSAKIKHTKLRDELKSLLPLYRKASADVELDVQVTFNLKALINWEDESVNLFYDFPNEERVWPHYDRHHAHNFLEWCGSDIQKRAEELVEEKENVVEELEFKLESFVATHDDVCNTYKLLDELFDMDNEA